MNRCEGCKLQKRDIEHRICIPPPTGKIRGCLISRDPTTEFRKPLKEYRQISSDHKGILWLNAPPCWLCQKIKDFMGFNENSQDLIKLRKFLNYECYWTHLHKCPTFKPANNDLLNQLDNERQYYPSFHYHTAKYCADQWFEFEFKKYGLKDKIIITLGRDVERYFKQRPLRHPDETSTRIITLPHPSSANCGNGWSWNKNSGQKELVVKEIAQLLQLL